MTSMIGPDCAVMCSIIYIHTHTLSLTHTQHTHTRVDSGSYSSRCCAFQRTHTSADTIRLLCIRLGLPLTLCFPSRFAPSARLMGGVSPQALWLAGAFSCDCMFWDDRGGRLTGQPLGPLVGTATMTAMVSANRDVVRSGVHTQAQILFGYFVSD